nr:sterol desaturase family protein [Kordiimonas marina]
MAGHGLKGLAADEIASLPTWAVLILAVAVSDLIAYWVHRVMHISWLWPVHAAHHSDRAANWLTLIRFHPLNRFIAVGLSALVFVPLGFPVWSVVASNWIRHFYGYFIHANVGWRFGPLRYVLVSPHLHRWHHSSDAVAFDRNFASVFALYDVIFGTFYSPKHEAGALGVSDPAYPGTWWGQTLYPFRVWVRALQGAVWRDRGRSGVPAE